MADITSYWLQQVFRYLLLPLNPINSSLSINPRQVCSKASCFTQIPPHSFLKNPFEARLFGGHRQMNLQHPRAILRILVSLLEMLVRWLRTFGMGTRAMSCCLVIKTSAASPLRLSFHCNPLPVLHLNHMY